MSLQDRFTNSLGVLYLLLFFAGMILLGTAAGCSYDPQTKSHYVLLSRYEPLDAEAAVQREAQRAAWVTETVRAASSHMSTADYEDVDETIEEAQEASWHMFPRRGASTNIVFGLGTVVGTDSYIDENDIVLPSQMSAVQRLVFDSLMLRTTPVFVDGSRHVFLDR